jgi:hypothetical protein
MQAVISSSDAVAGRGRLKALDATRGAAMLAVCFSHFGNNFAASRAGLGLIFTMIGMVATPLFLLVNGAAVGYVAATTRGAMSERRLKLVDRGLFVLLIGHVLLAMSGAASRIWLHSLHNALFRSIYITDVIGLTTCIAGLTLPYWRGKVKQLFIVALTLYLVACIMAMTNHSLPQVLQIPTLLLFGAKTMTLGTAVDFVTPVASYMAVILVGVAASQLLASKVERANGQTALGATLVRVGLYAVGAALLLKLLGLTLLEHVRGTWSDVIYLNTSIHIKLPPGPAYVLFYGGSGTLVAGLMLIAVAKCWFGRLIDALATVGRATFCVFVLQASVYWVLIPQLPRAWLDEAAPVWFALSLVALWFVALVWDRAGASRCLTVGLRRAHLRWKAAPSRGCIDVEGGRI